MTFLVKNRSKNELKKTKNVSRQKRRDSAGTYLGTFGFLKTIFLDGALGPIFILGASGPPKIFFAYFYTFFRGFV